MVLEFELTCIYSFVYLLILYRIVGIGIFHTLESIFPHIFYKTTNCISFGKSARGNLWFCFALVFIQWDKPAMPPRTVISLQLLLRLPGMTWSLFNNCSLTLYTQRPRGAQLANPFKIRRHSTHLRMVLFIICLCKGTFLVKFYWSIRTEKCIYH